MKHLYSALAAGLMLAAGAMNAEARYWTYDYTSAVTPDGIEAGQWYALQGGQSLLSGTNAFLAGDAHSDSQNLTVANLYQFVATGETAANGATVYYLKGYDGNYLYAPGQANFYGPAVERAWKVAVRLADTKDPEYSYVSPNEETGEDDEYTGMDAYIHEAADKNVPLDLSGATFCGADGAVVIASATPDNALNPQSTYTYLLGLGEGVTKGNASRGTDYTTNTWVIWVAEEQSATESLEAIVAELTNGDMTIDLSGYQLGDDAGEYSQELYDAFMALWEKADGVINGSLSLSDAEIDAIAEALPGALDAFKQSGKGLTEGYYILRSMRPEPLQWVPEYPWGGQNSGYDDGAIYDGSVMNPSDKNVRWSFKADDDVPFYLEGLDKTAYETAKFVWHATKSGMKDKWGNDLYYMQNVETGRYIGKDGGITYPIAMDDTPQQGYAIAANPNFPGWFSFYSPGLTVATEYGAPSPADYSGLHSAHSDNGVVPWDWRVAGSCWKVTSLTDEDIELLRSNLEAPQRLKTLQSLVEKAEDNIANGYAYDACNADGTPNANAKSGSLALDGLVTSVEQIACPMNEPTEGSLAALFDEDRTSYMHSTWSGNWTGDHYLQMTIEQPEDKLLFKWAKRNNEANDNSNKGAPKDVVIYGTNNEADLDVTEVDGNYNAWQKTWKQLGKGSFTYPFTDEQTNVENAIGYVGVALKEPVKYIRMAVKTRVNDSNVANGNKFFHGSEFRLYKAVANMEESLISAVPEDVLKELQDALAVANDEIADGAATAATIERLQAAYDKFLEHYPTPERLTNVIDQAKQLIDGIDESAEGEGMGYYEPGAIKALSQAIETAKAAVKPVMTNEEINNAKAALEAAIDAFKAALHVPADGLYIIRSNSSSTQVTTQTITATYASAEDNVNLRGGNGEANADLRAGSYWQTEKTDGGYTFRNLLTGMYLAPFGKTSDAMVQSTEPYVFTLRYAKEPGCFNIVLGEADAYNGNYFYVNAKPGTGTVVTWSSAEGRDNSAFAFEPQSLSEIDQNLGEQGMLFDVAYPDAPQAYTFTVDMDVFVDGGAFYTVIGQNSSNNNIELAEAKDGTTLKAGHAYIYIPEEGNGAETALFFLPEGVKLSEAEKVVEPSASNGLMGVFNSVELDSDGYGVFSSDHKSVLVSEAKDVVAAGTGYFCQMPETADAGDVSLVCNGKITGQTGIANVIDNRKANAVYSISGVRLHSVKNLPAGLYIINGKKYIVK